jgi:hypothetical protein
LLVKRVGFVPESEKSCTREGFSVVVRGSLARERMILKKLAYRMCLELRDDESMSF